MSQNKHITGGPKFKGTQAPKQGYSYDNPTHTPASGNSYADMKRQDLENVQDKNPATNPSTLFQGGDANRNGNSNNAVVARANTLYQKGFVGGYQDKNAPEMTGGYTDRTEGQHIGGSDWHSETGEFTTDQQRYLQSLQKKMSPDDQKQYQEFLKAKQSGQ